MVVQEINDIKCDSCVRKARVLVKDKNDKILIITIEGSYCLPGGTVEEGEDTKVTAMRELEEEVGLKLNDCDYLTTFTHYHENFPHNKINKIGKRVNIIDYYYTDLDESCLHESHPTNYELEHNMKILRVSPNEINDLFGAEPDSFKVFMDEELSTIITYAKVKGII